jgi:hypothetical protein
VVTASKKLSDAMPRRDARRLAMPNWLKQLA